MGALWGEPCDAEAYLGSITRVMAQPRGFDTACIDPRSLPLHPSRDPNHPLFTPPLCDSRALQHQQLPSANRYDDRDDGLKRDTHGPSAETTPFKTDSSSSPDQDGAWSCPASGAVEDVSTTATTPLKAPEQLQLTPGVLAAPSPARAAPSTSRFACQEADCLLQFSSQKDLDRHFESVHGTDLVKFRCVCGKLDSRKDNHDRHVRKCRLPKQDSYRCRCGSTSDRATAHLDHVARWQRRLGCPP